jgi:hypothetical protein
VAADLRCSSPARRGPSAAAMRRQLQRPVTLPLAWGTGRGEKGRSEHSACAPCSLRRPGARHPWLRGWTAGGRFAKARRPRAVSPPDTPEGSGPALGPHQGRGSPPHDGAVEGGRAKAMPFPKYGYARDVPGPKQVTRCARGLMGHVLLIWRLDDRFHETAQLPALDFGPKNAGYFEGRI